MLLQRDNLKLLLFFFPSAYMSNITPPQLFFIFIFLWRGELNFKLGAGLTSTRSPVFIITASSCVHIRVAIYIRSGCAVRLLLIRTQISVQADQAFELGSFTCHFS
jgi:hypothetical protein